MSDTKVQTIQDIYERFGRGDFNAILERVIDDVDWASEPDCPAPWHGVHRGKDALHNLFKSLGEKLDVTDFTPLAFASNETEVMVVIRTSDTQVLLHRRVDRVLGLIRCAT